MSLSEGTVDFSNGPGTNGYLTAGNPVTGTNVNSADADAFNVYLQAGVTYQFYIDGTTYPSGVENDLAYLNLYSPSGSLVGVSSGGGSETLTFTASVSGFYGASVQTGGGYGSYFLAYEPLSVSDDFGAGFGSASPFLVGSGPTLGQLEFAGDADGFQVATQAGQRYYYEFYTTVPDLYVKVQDGTYEGLPGVVVSGGGSGSFIADSTENVLLLVSSNSFTKTGDYYLYAAPTFTTAANLVMGGALNDTLTGTSGSDEMHGSWGQDSLSGGAGNDYLFGGPSSEADTLNGGSGADRMAGGLGNDSYVVDSTSDTVVESSGQGTDTVQSSATFTLGANVEHLTLTASAAINGTGNTLANTLTGNAAANTLNGGSGNDKLSGGAGNDILNGSTGVDTMTGGTGNDTYYVDVATDVISETTTTSTEIDTVQSAVSWTLGANLERLTLTGSAAINGTGNTLANTLTGNTAANSLNGGSGNDTLSGGAGNDILNGSTGVDKMTGGTGNDTYYVDVSTDVISETTTTSTEIDTVQSAVNWTLGANLERLTLTGSSAINGTGNTLANTLTGNGAANSLYGSSGNDTLSGGAGNDLLRGGTGNDILSGSSGSDTFRFDTALSTSTVTNLDQIKDFDSIQDTIQLENSIFTKFGTSTTGAISSAYFKANTTGLAQDSNDYIIYETDTGNLFYDSNGSAAGGSVQIAHLGANLSLTSADFLLV